MTTDADEIEADLEDLIDRRADEHWWVTPRARRDIAAFIEEREAKLRRDVDTLREVASCAAGFIAVSAKDQRDDEEEGDAYMHLYFAVQNLSAAKEKP